MKRKKIDQLRIAEIEHHIKIGSIITDEAVLDLIRHIKFVEYERAKLQAALTRIAVVVGKELVKK